MHKNTVPPLLPSTANYGSLQISGPGHFKGSSPVLDWNIRYNEGNTLELGDSGVLLENYVIEYYDTPFNYIDIDTSVATSQILQINNSPPCWWFVKNSSSFDITISPQINGTSSYDSTNEFIITNNTTCVLCITPGSPPLTDTLQNPTCMKLI
jgi:hypothetical protein